MIVFMSAFVYAIALTIGELTFRSIFRLSAELRRRIPNHKSWECLTKILEDVLLPTHRKTIGALLALMMGACYFSASDTVAFTMRLCSWDSAVLIAVYACWRLLGMTDTNMDTLHLIRASSGLDYGSGMALSYFHGYLKIVLPALGDSKDLRERLDDYEDSQRVRFPVKKLFILAPDSMCTPKKLTAATLSACRPLESVVLDRAGSVRREYHNSVYRVEQTGGWYVCCEGATPLQTFAEVLGSTRGSDGRQLERYRVEIVASFVRHLRRLLDEDEDCRDLAEVVTFGDRDAGGRRVDYGCVLRKAIEASLERGH